MRFQLLISCNNEAFYGEDCPLEVARLLEHVNGQLRTGRCGSGEENTVRDSNGNTVGTWAFIDDEHDEEGIPDAA